MSRSTRRRSHGPLISLISNEWQPIIGGSIYPHWTNGAAAPFRHQSTSPATVRRQGCKDTTYTVNYGTSSRTSQTLPPLRGAYKVTATYALARSIHYSATISGVEYAHKKSASALVCANTQAPSLPNPSYTNHHPRATPTNFPSDLSYDGQAEAVLPNPHSAPTPVVHSRGGREVFRIWNPNQGTHSTQSTSDKSTNSEAIGPQLPSQIGPIKKPRKLRQKSPKNGPPPQYTEEECKLYPFKCDECGIRMGRKQDMETHQLSHVKKTERKSVCPYAGCGKRLSRPDALKRHMATVHPLTSDPELEATIVQSILHL